MRNGWVAYELVFVIAFIGLIVSALVFSFDPLERARVARDERLRADSMTVVNALTDYFVAAGRAPWQDDFGSDSPYPALSWTPVNAPEVGVCKTKDCSEGGELIEKEKLEKVFWLRGSVRGSPNDILYIGKGNNARDPVFACFIPNSNKQREKMTELYQLERGKNLPPAGRPEVCTENVTWQEEDVCYVCMAK